jgi:excisionase family DNA binding protein
MPKFGVAPASCATSAAPAAVAAVLALEEAAAYLKVTPANVEAAIAAGDLKAKKIGSQYRIAKDAVDAFLAS